METEIITTLDPELFARLDTLIYHLESINLFLGTVTIAVLLFLGVSAAGFVCHFLFKAIKQLF